MAVAAVTDANFKQEVVQSDIPVVVDYWADWCAPCRQLSPIIDELAEQFAGQVKFVKLDTNANPDTPMQHGIMALPTLQFWAKGEVVKVLQGGKTKAAIIKAVEEAQQIAGVL